MCDLKLILSAVSLTAVNQVYVTNEAMISQTVKVISFLEQDYIGCLGRNYNASLRLRKTYCKLSIDFLGCEK